MQNLNAGRPTIAEINLENLRFNLRSTRAFIGEELKYLAVVKADAYGHGAVECSRALEAEGADWLGVAISEEALQLREAGIKLPILSFGSFWPGQEDLLLERDITPAIFDLRHAELINKAAKKAGETFPVHVKIDTGMGRVGVRWNAVEEFVSGLTRFESLSVEGVMTHFASADDLKQNEFTDLQIKRLHDSVHLFESAGFYPTLIDLANSPGAVVHTNARGNMVRLGGILYGLGGDVLPLGVPKPELRPVMSLHTTIAQLKSVAPGETLGYGRTFTTARDSLIATIPIGYDDGYPRQLSNAARVIVNGNYAPVVGRVSMDWTIIDVTDVRGVNINDQVVLIGSQGDLSVSAEDLAKLTNTISYEITCGISGRVPRQYHGVDHGNRA